MDFRYQQNRVKALGKRKVKFSVLTEGEKEKPRKEKKILIPDKAISPEAEGEKEKPRKEKKILIPEKAISPEEDRVYSILGADDTECKDILPLPNSFDGGKAFLIPDDAFSLEDRVYSILGADDTECKDFVTLPYSIDDDKAFIRFETLAVIETLREVHSKDEDSISVIQRFEKMVIDYCSNDIDLRLFPTVVDNTTQHVNDVSDNFKDSGQAIAEGLDYS